MNFLVPYTASELLAVDPAGGIWRAVSSDYRLTHFATTGDSTRVVQRAFTPLPLSAADRNRALRLARSLAKEGGDADESLIPATKPPLHSILLDDVGYLWAALSPPDDSATVSFDVFDRAGRYLGAVPSPLKVPSLSPTPTVRGSALSYVTRDSLDVQYIVRMRIVGR